MNSYQHKVQYYETDKMGIVHHSNYVRWMEEARMDFLSKIGWDYKKIEDDGIISPVIAIECKYVKTTTFSDLIEIVVKVEEFRGVKLKLKYEMKRDNVLVCEGRSEHCFLDDNGRIMNIKREYPEFFDALTSMVER